MIGEGKRPAVYSDFIDELIQQIAEIDVNTQHKNEEKEKLTVFLIGVFKNCCAELAPVVKYLTATTEFSEQECDAAGAACKGYVHYFRSHLTEIRKVVKSANVKPKMHVLEQHVPEWLGSRQHRSTVNGRDLGVCGGMGAVSVTGVYYGRGVYWFPIFFRRLRYGHWRLRGCFRLCLRPNIDGYSTGQP